MKRDDKKAAVNCWIDKRLVKRLKEETKRQKRSKTALVEMALQSMFNGKEAA